MTVSRLVGGVLSGGVSCEISAMGGHPSVRPTWEIDRASPSLFGLAPGGVCRAARVTPGAGALLPHRFTLACARRPSAVCSLLHFPAGHPDWPLASTLALWSPDLPRPGRCRAAATRPARHIHSPTCLRDRRCRAPAIAQTPLRSPTPRARGPIPAPAP